MTATQQITVRVNNVSEPGDPEPPDDETDTTSADCEPFPTSGPPTVRAADTTATEGNPLEFHVTLCPEIDEHTSVTVRWRLQPIDASAGSDYVDASGELTILPGDTLKRVSVATKNDDRDEGEEDLWLILSAPAGTSVQRLPAAGTITDMPEEGSRHDHGEFTHGHAHHPPNKGYATEVYPSHTHSGHTHRSHGRTIAK